MSENPFSINADLEPSEFKLHMAIKKHYETCFIGSHNPNLKIWHNANENRDSTQGYFNKMLGQLKGLPDIMAGWPHSQTGICEIKLPGKPLTNDQNKVLSWARAIGWHTGIARSVKQFHHVAVLWGLKPAHHNIVRADFRNTAAKHADAFDMFAPPPGDEI